MSKPTIETVKKAGEELAKVRAEIRTIEERQRAETEALYLREKALKEEMLVGLKAVGLASFKASSGEAYSISKTFDFEVTNPIAYEDWARDNRCVRVDATAAKQRIRKAVEAGAELPFIKTTERETISIRAAKKEAA